MDILLITAQVKNRINCQLAWRKMDEEQYAWLGFIWLSTILCSGWIPLPGPWYVTSPPLSMETKMRKALDDNKILIHDLTDPFEQLGHVYHLREQIFRPNRSPGCRQEGVVTL